MRRRQKFAAQTAKPTASVKPLTLEELKARYVAKFGKLPHWKMKPETIAERLQ